MKNDPFWRHNKKSINDDLETFFNNLQDPKPITHELAFSFFTPQLTEKELKLVEERNEQHLSSYSSHFFGKNPDVDAEKMKKSDSPSKFVAASCWRYTIPFEL